MTAIVTTSNEIGALPIPVIAINNMTNAIMNNNKNMDVVMEQLGTINDNDYDADVHDGINSMTATSTTATTTMKTIGNDNVSENTSLNVRALQLAWLINDESDDITAQTTIASEETLDLQDIAGMKDTSNVFHDYLSSYTLPINAPHIQAPAAQSKEELQEILTWHTRQFERISHHQNSHRKRTSQVSEQKSLDKDLDRSVFDRPFTASSFQHHLERILHNTNISIQSKLELSPTTFTAAKSSIPTESKEQIKPIDMTNLNSQINHAGVYPTSITNFDLTPQYKDETFPLTNIPYEESRISNAITKKSLENIRDVFAGVKQLQGVSIPLPPLPTSISPSMLFALSLSSTHLSQSKREVFLSYLNSRPSMNLFHSSFFYVLFHFFPPSLDNEEKRYADYCQKLEDWRERKEWEDKKNQSETNVCRFESSEELDTAREHTDTSISNSDDTGLAGSGNSNVSSKPSRHHQRKRQNSETSLIPPTFIPSKPYSVPSGPAVFSEFTAQPLQPIFKLMSSSYISLFLLVNYRHKDLFFEHFYDWLAQSLCHALMVAFPLSSAILSTTYFRSHLLVLTRQWCIGYVSPSELRLSDPTSNSLPMFSTNHWAMLPVEQDQLIWKQKERQQRKLEEQRRREKEENGTHSLMRKLTEIESTLFKDSSLNLPVLSTSRTINSIATSEILPKDNHHAPNSKTNNNTLGRNGSTIVFRAPYEKKSVTLSNSGFVAAFIHSSGSKAKSPFAYQLKLSLPPADYTKTTTVYQAAFEKAKQDTEQFHRSTQKVFLEYKQEKQQHERKARVESRIEQSTYQRLAKEEKEALHNLKHAARSLVVNTQDDRYKNWKGTSEQLALRKIAGGINNGALSIK